jgi:hypothetical protein
VTPYDQNDPARGPTCSCNIAVLCRRHHRLKTHTPWRYQVIEPGTQLWTSPHGYQFLVDATGTRDVTPTHQATNSGCTHPTPTPSQPPDQ